MDVSDEDQQIVLFGAGDGIEAILEEVADAVVPAVEMEGVGGEEAAHEGRNAALGGAQEEMGVSGHERPGKAVGGGLGQEVADAVEEEAVGVVEEGGAPFDAPDQDMGENPGDGDVGVARHASFGRFHLPTSGREGKLLLGRVPGNGRSGSHVGHG